MAIASKEVRTLKGSAVCDVARGDARLVAALRGGSDEAFTLLVADYQTAVYNLAWRLVRNREDARDIAQDVFLKAFQQIPKTKGELRLWAWLYRVTVNTCWDHLRARRRRPILSEEPLEEGDHRSDVGEDQADLARVFVASLAQLPPRQQAALLLKDVHGLRHGDIATILGISRGSSEVLLFRARRSFRSVFTAITADVQRDASCRFAEQVAAHSVGGRLTEARSRRVLEHAATCPDCRRTVERWSGVRAVGLGLALPLSAAPQIFGAQATATVAASTMVTVGASSVAGGLTAKLAGIGVAKAAVVALAATAVVTCGGATAHKDYVKDGGPRMAIAPVLVAAASPRPAASPGIAGTSAASVRTIGEGDLPHQRPPSAEEGRAPRTALPLRSVKVDGQPDRARPVWPRFAASSVSVRRADTGGLDRVTRVGASTRAARGAVTMPKRVAPSLGRQTTKVDRQATKPERSAPRRARTEAPSGLLRSAPGSIHPSGKAQRRVTPSGSPARPVAAPNRRTELTPPASRPAAADETVGRLPVIRGDD